MSELNEPQAWICLKPFRVWPLEDIGAKALSTCCGHRVFNSWLLVTCQNTMRAYASPWHHAISMELACAPCMDSRCMYFTTSYHLLPFICFKNWNNMLHHEHAHRKRCPCPIPGAYASLVGSPPRFGDFGGLLLFWMMCRCEGIAQNYDTSVETQSSLELGTPNSQKESN